MTGGVLYADRKREKGYEECTRPAACHRDRFDPDAILMTVMTCRHVLGSLLAVVLVVDPVSQLVCGMACMRAGDLQAARVKAREPSPGCHGDQTGHRDGLAPTLLPLPEDCSHDLRAAGPFLTEASKRRAPKGATRSCTLAPLVRMATSNVTTLPGSTLALTAQCRVQALGLLLPLRI